MHQTASPPNGQEIRWTIDTLDNGLRLVTTPLPQSQAVVVAAYVGVGSRHEQRATLGLSHYLEHMLFKGTERRPSALAISAAIEGAGGDLNAFTSKELTCFWNRLPSDRLELAMEILADSLRASLLAPEEVERERTVIQQEIRRAHDDPAQRAFQLLSDAAYGDQPLGWEIAGDLDSVAATTRDHLRDHIDAWYRPHNLVLSVAGNVDPHHVRALAERAWSDFPARATAAPPAAQPTRASEPVLVEQRDIEQCNLGLALRTFPRTDADRYPLTILNTVLGRGMSSRLFLEVRERRGLAYHVGSGTARFQDTGHLGISAGVTREHLAEAVTVILHELDRLRDEPVGRAELDKACEHTTGSFRLGLETAAAHCHRNGESLLMENEIKPIEDVVRQLRAVTPDDLQRVARRFIRRDNVAMALVGPYDDAPALAALLTA